MYNEPNYFIIYAIISNYAFGRPMCTYIDVGIHFWVPLTVRMQLLFMRQSRLSAQENLTLLIKNMTMWYKLHIVWGNLLFQLFIHATQCTTYSTNPRNTCIYTIATVSPSWRSEGRPWSTYGGNEWWMENQSLVNWSTSQALNRKFPLVSKFIAWHYTYLTE